MTTLLCGYLNGDASAITNAEGKPIATVCATRRVRLPRRSWMHGASMLSVWARDANGRRYYGRGSPMLALRMRQIAAATV